MEIFKKTYWLIYPFLIVIFMLIFDQIYKTDNIIPKALGCGLLAYILSPRKKIIKTQAKVVKQITWIFLKNPILLNS
jgi:hypothetical protein